jgi:hypothetical protein
MSEDNKKDPQLVDQIIKQIVTDKSPVKQARDAKIPLAHTKSPPIIEKKYYDVKVECMIPATLTFRVLAEDPIQAADLIRGASPRSVQHRLVGRKDIKLSVYEAGTTMLKWMKNLLVR